MALLSLRRKIDIRLRTDLTNAQAHNRRLGKMLHPTADGGGR